MLNKIRTSDKICCDIVLILIVIGLICVLYSVITRLNTKTVADNPFYILIAIAVIGGSIIFSSKKVIVYIKKN